MTKVHNWNTAWLLSWFSLSLSMNKYFQRILFWIIVNDPALQILQSRVAEVVRGHGGPPPKSLDSDEIYAI